MASVEQRFRDGILADPVVASLIGIRLYDRQLPQNPVYPCGVYQRISTVPIYSQQLGGSNAQMGWIRFQVDVFASGPGSGLAASNLAVAITNALQGFNLSGQPESPTVLRQAPNYLVMRKSGVKPDLQPPLFTERLDVRSFYQEE